MQSKEWIRGSAQRAAWGLRVHSCTPAPRGFPFKGGAWEGRNHTLKKETMTSLSRGYLFGPVTCLWVSWADVCLEKTKSKSRKPSILRNRHRTLSGLQLAPSSFPALCHRQPGGSSWTQCGIAGDRWWVWPIICFPRRGPFPYPFQKLSWDQGIALLKAQKNLPMCANFSYHTD